MIEYKLVRSSRKTLAIHILDDASVEVRAPYQCPVSVIEDFINKKLSWIEKKKAERKAEINGQLANDREFCIGETLLYRGDEYPVKLIDSEVVGFNYKAFYVPKKLANGSMGYDTSHAIIVDLYKRLALPFVWDTVKRYSDLMKLQPVSVKISKARKRWGSCSSNGTLNFSWMLATVNQQVLDYVVVHELCHIIEHNHSVRFWKLVESIMPDYSERKQLLKAAGRRLMMYSI
jgi:predicted metal-dependent hydrolase